MEKNNTALTNKLSSLKAAYLTKIEETILVLEHFSAPIIELEEIYSHVHKISGTSGMYGFTQISNLSTEFEIFLKEIKSQPKNDCELIETKFQKYLKSLKDLVLKEGENYA